jgi:ribose/xylose/arabinose/galactoside ABC-type transport system permease subunit
VEKKERLKDFYDKYLSPLLRHKVFSLALLLIAMVIMFTIWAELQGRGNHFFKATTLRNILNSLVVSSFLAIGAGSLLIAGHIDLSQSAVGAFGGIMLATAVARWNLPWFVGIIVSLLLCAIFGALNGVLVNKYHFPSFIGTLAMASMAKGLMFLFSSVGNNGLATNIVFQNDPLSFIGMGRVGPVPFGVIVMLLFFLAYGLLISKAKFGMKVSLIGGNPIAAHLAGINSTVITYLLFMNSAVLGGVAGIFNTARLGQGALVALQTSQFTGITAAILGGISFGGGAGGMGGAFIGLLILNTFQIGMGVVGVNPDWVNVFTGFLLLIALCVDFIAQRRVSKA